MPSKSEELLQFVLAASRSSLGDLWLIRLNEADNLERKLLSTLSMEIPKLVEARAEAMLAEFLRDHGEELMAGQVSSSAPPSTKTLLMEAAREPRNASPPKSARRCGSKSA